MTFCILLFIQYHNADEKKDPLLEYNSLNFYQLCTTRDAACIEKINTRLRLLDDITASPFIIENGWVIVNFPAFSDMPTPEEKEDIFEYIAASHEKN